MFDHVGLKVKDLGSSKRFYAAALAPLGLSVQYEDKAAVGLGPKGAPALWLMVQSEKGGPAHIALAAKDRAAVKAFHAAAIEAGGKDNGKPGLRTEYHPNYYGAFVTDPDGNNVEAVCHKEQ
jgi:catechol 2,3-dioxygenase-like lactoylglutathione lyase family enzyme